MPNITAITEQWNHLYDTNAHAQPIQHRRVDSALVVHIEQAYLRGSHFAGFFEVAHVPSPFDVVKGRLRVQCKVGWFGMKPKTTWSHISIVGKWQLLPNYTGSVVHNIGVPQ